MKIFATFDFATFQQLFDYSRSDFPDFCLRLLEKILRLPSDYSKNKFH
nr:MAG TPA: hypothetical protein [Caudoviricetes sp.]